MALCQHFPISHKEAKMKPVTVTYRLEKHNFMANVTKHSQAQAQVWWSMVNTFC